MIGGRRGERKRSCTYYPSYRPDDTTPDMLRKIVRPFRTGEARINVVGGGATTHGLSSGSTVVPYNCIYSIRTPEGGTKRVGDYVLEATAPVVATEFSGVGYYGTRFSFGGPLLTRIDQSCADNAATNIVLAAVADSVCFHVTYRAYTTFGGKEYCEGGSLTVVACGNSAAITGWTRAKLGDGRPLIDGSGLTADVSGGNVRLIVTTASRGAACDFRATYYEVEA